MPIWREHSNEAPPPKAFEAKVRLSHLISYFDNDEAEFPEGVADWGEILKSQHLDLALRTFADQIPRMQDVKPLTAWSILEAEMTKHGFDPDHLFVSYDAARDGRIDLVLLLPKACPSLGFQSLPDPKTITLLR